MAETPRVMIAKLNNDNYESWRLKVELLLIEEGLWEVISKAAPAQPDAEWLMKDVQARATIRLLVEDNQLTHIRSKTTAAATWKALQDYHTKSSLSTALCLVFPTMNPTRLITFCGDEESRSTRSEDHNTYSVLRTEEEKQRRRRKWQLQQERERQYEKLKQQKILEYERNRAQALMYAEYKSSRHSRSKSGSESPSHLLYRGRSTSTSSTASKSGSLHEKLDEPTTGTVPLFRGPQNAPINTMELRRIKIEIHRNIPVQGQPVPELQRDILNPEDVIIKRREGEGCKPIFDREEIKKSTIKTNEVEERYTVAAIDKENDGASSLEKHREYKEKYTERDVNKHDANRSRSRELHNSRPFMEEKSYRDRYRERSNERSHERADRDRDRERERKRERERERDRERERERERDRDRDRERERERKRERKRDRDRDRDRNKDRDRSRERRDIAPHYIESPIPVPIYCSSFPPRPIVVSPMAPLRGQIPPMGRGRHPALMAPVRPFPPRFPPDMYRLGHPPPNPRFGPF